MLTDQTIRRHLEGEITVGLYPINPPTQRCKWVAIDADYRHAMEDLLKLQFYLTQDRVASAPEMSKRGGHLWIFLATPLLAKECQIYVYDSARRLAVQVKGAGLADGIEVFPKHDAIAPGDFDNAIRGPLGIHRGADRRFWFYGADYTLEAQIEYLNRLRKVTEDELRMFIAGKEPPRPEFVATYDEKCSRETTKREQSLRIPHSGTCRKRTKSRAELCRALSFLCRQPWPS
jgi:hypothetical protein